MSKAKQKKQQRQAKKAARKKGNQGKGNKGKKNQQFNPLSSFDTSPRTRTFTETYREPKEIILFADRDVDHQAINKQLDRVTKAYDLMKSEAFYDPRSEFNVYRPGSDHIVLRTENPKLMRSTCKSTLEALVSENGRQFKACPAPLQEALIYWKVGMESITEREKRVTFHTGAGGMWPLVLLDVYRGKSMGDIISERVCDYLSGVGRVHHVSGKLLEDGVDELARRLRNLAHEAFTAQPGDGTVKIVEKGPKQPPQDSEPPTSQSERKVYVLEDSGMGSYGNMIVAGRMSEVEALVEVYGEKSFSTPFTWEDGDVIYAYLPSFSGRSALSTFELTAKGFAEERIRFDARVGDGQYQSLGGNIQQHSCIMHAFRQKVGQFFGQHFFGQDIAPAPPESKEGVYILTDSYYESKGNSVLAFTDRQQAMQFVDVLSERGLAHSEPRQEDPFTLLFVKGQAEQPAVTSTTFPELNIVDHQQYDVFEGTGMLPGLNFDLSNSDLLFGRLTREILAQYFSQRQANL